MRLLPAALALVALVTVGGARAQLPPQPTDVRAVHRAGQTFVTWRDTADPTARFHVYRSAKPIRSAEDVRGDRVRKLTAQPDLPLVRALPVGSGAFWADRFFDPVDPARPWRPRYLTHLAVPDGDGGVRTVGADEGLFVWTPDATDLDLARAEVHYAITRVDADGRENLSDFGPANTTGLSPVRESIAEPRPIDVTSLLAGTESRTDERRVYVQYMDLRQWNPTAHAPNPLLGDYGVDPATPGLAHALQYAYTYSVVIPRVAPRPDGTSTALPVVLQLHYYIDPAYGYPAESVPPDDAPASFPGAICLRPIDVGNTFWLGFARHYDFRRHPGGPAPVPDADRAQNEIVNYTEHRVLRMIHDLIEDLRLESGPVRVDEERIYVDGHSMGGSGALAFAMRYPDVFAAAYAKQAITDYGGLPDDVFVPMNYVRAPERCWFARAVGAPIRTLAGPGGRARHLVEGDGTSVWEWQNQILRATAHPEVDRVPFGLEHGTHDHFVRLEHQAIPAYPAFDRAGLCWGAVVSDEYHFPSPCTSPSGRNTDATGVVEFDFEGLPPTLEGPAGDPGHGVHPEHTAHPWNWLNRCGVPFAGLRVVKSETVPGLRASAPVAPPDPARPVPQGFNQRVAWSASWDPWDGAPVDEIARWEMSLRTVDGDDAIVDVIPRRCQRFTVTPSTRYRWRVVDSRAPDAPALQGGEVSADARGLLIVPGVEVAPQLPSGGYSRLIVEPLP